MEEGKEEDNSIEQEENNIVYIGEKPFMNYVSSVDILFSLKNQEDVIIRARGKFINRAVDVAEVSKKRGSGDKEIYVKDIKINSEKFENKERKIINVSTIEIILAKR